MNQTAYTPPDRIADAEREMLGDQPAASIPRAAASAYAGGKHRKAAAINYLYRRKLGFGGGTIYLVLRRTSRSAETAIVQAFRIDAEHMDLDAIGMYVALATETKYDQATAGGGMVIRGFGRNSYQRETSRLMDRLAATLGVDDLDWEWL